MKKSDYKPYGGFYDLRDFNLTEKMFVKLCKIQDYLNHVNEHKYYYQKMDKNTWEKAKELSAQYQQYLHGIKHSIKRTKFNRKKRTKRGIARIF